MRRGIVGPRTAVLYGFACWLAGATAGCGSTVATSTGPSPTKCGVTLTPPTSPVNSSGDTATVTVSTQAECAWTATSEASWITGLTPSSGQGAGQVQMQVAANPDASARQGNILINGERARVSQDAAPCRFELSSTAQSFTASGGSGRISVSTLAGCEWAAQPDSQWVAITSGATGTGSGAVSFTVAPNPGSARTGALVIAGQTARIAQEAVLPVNCTYAVSPASVTAPAAGSDTNSVAVTALAGCEWSAASNTSWIDIIGKGSGAGNGAVSFSIASNSGAARTGTLTVADQTILVNQASTSCSYVITPTTTSIAAAGGAGVPISVQTADTCAWTAVSNASWLTVTSGAAGTGNGSVGFSASANSGTARTGTLTIAGQSITVTQISAACSATVTPRNVSVPSTGTASSSVSVSVPSGCAWTAASNVTWISIVSGATGTGNGSVTFAVAANSTGAVRIGTLTIAGQSVTVTQAAASCSYTVNPTSLSVAAAGGATAPVSVTAADGCAWTASTGTSWLSVTAGATGVGNGTVTITAAANTGAARTGTVTVANQTVTVSQAGVPCSYTVASTSASVGAAGGAGAPISVTTSSGCSWTATTNVSWITIVTGASGTGSGTVTFSVQPNTGAARTGTLTVAGQTVTISQSAACVYSISPPSQIFDNTGGTGGPVTVTTQSGCAWTAVSNASWISVTSGSSGTGTGSVSFTVAANTGGMRTGTLTIAGSTFTVSQQKK